MDLSQWVWWQWTIFGVAVYLFLGLYGALMHFKDGSDDDEFWSFVVFWFLVLFIDQIPNEIIPYYRKRKQTRIAKRLRGRNDAFEKKYGVEAIK